MIHQALDHRRPQIAGRWFAAVQSVAAAAGVTDTFNRADSTTTLGNADTGQAWAPNSGTWGIDTNRARLVSATSQATTVVNSGLADGTVGATLAVLATGVGVCFRSTDDNNHFVVEGSANNNTRSDIYRRQAGEYTLLAAEGSAYLNGDVMEVVLSGSSIILKKNGTQLLSTTDAFNATATRHGLRSHNILSARFDNFSVSP